MIRKLFSRWHNPVPEAPEMDDTAPPGSPEWYAASAEFWGQMAQFWRDQEQFWDRYAKIQKDAMWLWAVVMLLLVAVAVMSAVSG
jgi:hypothetical protein